MKVNEIITEDGRIVKGVNTTVDVKPGETERQAKKFFGGNGKPKPLGVPGATAHQAFNLGMTNESVNIDNKDGRGATPNNAQVDYFGMRVKMKPSTFIALASKLGREPKDEMIDYIKNGGSIASPFLSIKVDGTDEPAQVTGHEGRNRMLAIMKAFGDESVEVHLFFNSNSVNRARHLTPEIESFIKKHLISQDDVVVNGPLWENKL